MIISRNIEIALPNGFLAGELKIPSQSQSIIIFAHGSGSSRLSPRNKLVAEIFNKAGFATLLLDLLSKQEAKIDLETKLYRFDIELLSARLRLAIHWLQQDILAGKHKVGLFGASSGTGAALVAAASMPNIVKAVVSRGGRPELANKYLHLVKAPTLLIVGALDEEVLELNKVAIRQIYCMTKLKVVPKATHLFQEPGTLEEAAKLATLWFEQYLSPPITPLGYSALRVW